MRYQNKRAHFIARSCIKRSSVSVEKNDRNYESNVSDQFGNLIMINNKICT